MKFTEKNHELIWSLMFDWESFSEKQIQEFCRISPKKVVRWLGTYHPDNKTRKIFFRMSNVTIGADTVINKGFTVFDDYEPLLSIGDRVAIASDVTVICSSGPNNSRLVKNPYIQQNLIKKDQVKISDDAWIGTNCVLLPGIKIGVEAVIGAGSIVTRDVPDHTIVAGVPARVIKEI